MKNKELKNLVGGFYKTFYHSNMVYGLVDSVYGNKVGFVWAADKQWGGFLVQPNELEMCVDDELGRAIKSAQMYWDYEVKSLEGRIAQNYAIDDPVYLCKLLNAAREWQKTLSTAGR